MTFRATPTLRIIDFDITLTAPEKVVFGDTKEGAFAIRLADALTEKSGSGKMVNAEGQQGMAAIWGNVPLGWITRDARRREAGSRNFRPSLRTQAIQEHWHARDYGLFALNPWGQHAFDPAASELKTTLPAKGSLHFRWRVVIHEGDAPSAHIADLYQEFSK